MKTRWLQVLGLVVVLGGAGLAVADEHGHGRPDEHARPDEHGAHAVRGPAPKFQAHPPGVHPHGPQGHAHAVRVLAPKVVVHAGHPAWHHWAHPEFTRPAYYWDWGAVHHVTCVAEDSYGDQYPVSEDTWAGFNLEGMTEVEDNALDRCYDESGHDTSCYLATCSHF